MILSIITDKKEIKKLHIDFETLMRNNSTGRQRNLRLSTRGGAWDSDAYYNEENDLWWTNDRLSKKNKYYNLIGIHPDFNSTNHILIQLNYQIEFRSFIEGCFWAKDPRGHIFLLHSGRMGGGVEGITIENVDHLYSGSRSILLYNKIETEYFTVCEIHSTHAFQQVVSFVYEINRIKKILKSNTTSPSSSKRKSNQALRPYTPEFWGKRKSYFLKGAISSSSNHGFIVDCLEKTLNNKFRIKKTSIVKNKYVDLGIIKNGRAHSIFEIKSSINSQSIYTAIGQLMLHSSAVKSHPNKFIVLPSLLEEETEKDILELSIFTIRFVLNNNNVQFVNLDKYF